MTTEELINHIKYNLEINADVFLTDEDARMVIKALERSTGHWIMKSRTHNEVKHYTGQDEMGETHTISVLERYEVDEPYCSECGKLAGDTSQNYCCACGARMVESEETETWNGIHAQITAPKGTFERIFNNADDDNDI